MLFTLDFEQRGRWVAAGQEEVQTRQRIPVQSEVMWLADVYRMLLGFGPAAGAGYWPESRACVETFNWRAVVEWPPPG